MNWGSLITKFLVTAVIVAIIFRVGVVRKVVVGA